MKDLTAILQHHFEDNTELARRCRCHPWLATLPHRPRYHRVSELEHGEALISEMLPGFPSDGLAASALPPLPPAGP